MKKLFLFITFIIFVVNVNAQNLQKGVYNDGKVYVYIEQRKGTVTNYYGNGKMDELIIENISGQVITLQYCFRAVKLDENNRFEQDKMVYENKTLEAGKKISENGRAAYNGKIGSYYVESFAITNVSVKNSSTQQNKTETKQAVAVPSWAQGTWWYNESGIRITTTQIVLWNGYVLNCTRNDGNIIYFSDYYAILKTNSPNKVELAVFNDNKWTNFPFSKK